MKLIVNNNQYKRLIKHTHTENILINEWGVFVKDMVIKNLENKNINENIISLNKLSLKLKNRKFFNDLPIDNLTLNIYSENVDNYSCEVDLPNLYLDKKRKIKDLVLEMVINNKKELYNFINEKEITLQLLKVKNWYENFNKG